MTHCKENALYENGRLVWLKSAILATLEFILELQLEVTVLSVYESETGTS